MAELEKIVVWVVGAFVTLITWIFKSSQGEQNRRLGTLEKNQQKIKDDAVSLERAIFDAFERINKEDEARHERDRLETKEDLRIITQKNDEAHDRIMDRLDTLINGKK